MTQSPVHRSEIREWFREAVADTFAVHRKIWELGVGERARVAQILTRLREIVPAEWDVDSEWNRQGRGGDQKWLPSTEAKDRWGVPDIIVHRRGEFGAENNLLIAEFKLDSANMHEGSEDYLKVDYWITSIGYRQGALVDLGDASHRPSVMWLDRNGPPNLEEL